MTFLGTQRIDNPNLRQSDRANQENNRRLLQQFDGSVGQFPSGGRF